MKKSTTGKQKVWGFVILVAMGSGFFLGAAMPKTSKAIEYIAGQDKYVESPDRLAAKIDSMKEEVLNKLAQCESAGRKPEDGIAILDTNNKGSYGPFQWQVRSLQHYYEMRNKQELNGRDAIVLALFEDKARDMAKWVIFDTDAGVATDWVNCSKKYGLQARVDLIKELEK